MEKLVVLDIDTHMPDFTAGFEEDQVTGAQLAAPDGFADLGLVPGGAGKLNAKVIAVGGVYQPGAVDSPLAQATQ